MAAWGSYQSAIREVVRAQWLERRALLALLGMVEATHRDAFTMEYLSKKLRLQNWSYSDVRFARHVTEKYGVTLLGT
jgi:hypothetical protein